MFWNYEGITNGVDFKPRVADPWLHPVISGDAWSWRPVSKSSLVLHARLSLDDDGRSIDLATPNRKESLRGIYDIDGDILRICLSTDRPGAARPGDFTVLPLDREVTLTYRRVGLDVDKARMAEMRCLGGAIYADTSVSKAFSRLSLAASAGRIPIQPFEVGVPHCGSVLLRQLRSSIGVVAIKIVASPNDLNNQSYFYVMRGVERQARYERLHQEQRAAVRARMKRRDEAIPSRPRDHEPD